MILTIFFSRFVNMMFSGFRSQWMMPQSLVSNVLNKESNTYQIEDNLDECMGYK